MFSSGPPKALSSAKSESTRSEATGAPKVGSGGSAFAPSLG